MKRKTNKNTKLTPTEEINLRRHICEKIQNRDLCTASYMLVSDVWKREELKEIFLDKALKKYMVKNPEVSEHAIVAYSLYDMSNLDGWVSVRLNDSMPASGYLLEEGKAEEALVPMRKGFRSLKKCLKESDYRAIVNMVPTTIEAHASGVELYSTPLGVVIYWNPGYWIVVTNTDYQSLMLQVRSGLHGMEFKRSSNSKLAVNLGADFCREFNYENDSYLSASEFFTEETLMWTRSKVQELNEAAINLLLSKI